MTAPDWADALALQIVADLRCRRPTKAELNLIAARVRLAACERENAEWKRGFEACSQIHSDSMDRAFGSRREKAA